MARILVVDDRPLNRELLITVLGYGGHQLLEASDGAEALRLVTAERPHLVIADILMPTMDGYEFVRAIRSDPAVASTPVIFCTAHYHEREAEALAQACGVFHILYKPVEPARILEVVDSVLKAASTPATIPDATSDFDRQHLRLVTDKLAEKSEELRLANLRLTTLVEVSRQLASNRDSTAMLESCCCAARELGAARFAVLGVLNGSGRTKFVASSGLAAEIRSTLDFTVQPGGAMARILQDRQPCRMGGNGGAHSLGFAHHPAVDSFLGVPLAHQETCYGWLYLADKLGLAEFQDDDERIIVALADQAAVLYANLGLYDNVQSHAVALERSISESKRLESQLRQAQKMEAIGRLAGGVAHDFNNLLTVINGHCDLILSNLAPDHPLRESIEEIHKAGQRSASLTLQLLAFSRRQVTQPKILDLNSVVADILNMLRRLIGEQIELVVAADPASPAIQADSTQIQQVLMNLAVNARDAMPHGGSLKIETAIAEVDEAAAALDGRAGRFALLTVTDTGSGMDEHVKNHLFEPFFTTKPQGIGTGLGLSTVYGIVKQCGGWINVTSKLGEGSAFKLYLPLAGAKASPEEPRSRPAEPSSGSETILLVEDDSYVRKLASAMLRRRGYNVVEAGGSSEAMRICEQDPRPIHLLLTDVGLPGISGRALADYVKTTRPEVKIVFMSGYSDSTLLDPMQPASEIVYLQKPFTYDTLTAVVRQSLDTSHRTAGV